MGAIDRLAMLAGAAILIGGLVLLGLSIPTHVTHVQQTTASELSAPADGSGTGTTPPEPIPFRRLSPAEQTTVEQAIGNSDGVFEDLGASEQGDTFEYRNDVVRRYVVERRGQLLAVRVLVEIHPIRTVLGAVATVFGLILAGVGTWRSRRE